MEVSFGVSVAYQNSKRGPLSIESLEHRTLLTANWGLDALDAHEVWDRGITGQDVVVAVIDSGMNLHPDLSSSLWRNMAEKRNTVDDDGNGFVNDFNGWDFADDDNMPLSNTRHGNHVTGIIAAADNDIGTTGVAHGAKVMPLRVFDDDGSTSWHDIASAIRFAVDSGADIINLSVDGIATSSVESAIGYADANEVLIVASAGNHQKQAPSFPASASSEYANVLSVGAHDENFRRWKGTNSAGRQGVVQVDAPGVNIPSTSVDGGYGSSSGTSSASAHVAGVAALVLSASPNLTAEQLRDAIVSGATKTVSGSDSIGAVNANRSVSLVNSVDPGTLPADFDKNGVVDFSDFLSLSQHYGLRGTDHADGDVDENGVVDFRDFLTLSQMYGKRSVPPPPSAVDAAFGTL